MYRFKKYGGKGKINKFLALVCLFVLLFDFAPAENHSYGIVGAFCLILREIESSLHTERDLLRSPMCHWTFVSLGIKYHQGW